MADGEAAKFAGVGMNMLKCWRGAYSVENDYRRSNYGGWRFTLYTPLFAIELTSCAPEIYRRVYSSRFAVAWHPRGWFIQRGEILYAKFFERTWDVAI